MSGLLAAILPASPGALRRAGVLGMNWRNMMILARWNPKPLYRLVDDKLATKELCARCGVATPTTYAVVDHPVQVRRLDGLVGGRDAFVIKPARGARGRGVLIIVGKADGGFATASGQTLSLGELREHILAILGGVYSIGGRADRAIIEQRVAPHAALAGMSAGGTPDVRVIAYRGRAVMAMLRLPTRASGGRANLHQGAMGVGLDLNTGRGVAAVYRGRATDRHADSGLPVAEIAVPTWQAVLDVAVRLAGATGLGYVGVDVVLAEAGGPVVLEANGRPGLSIQVANRCGLLKRIAEVDAG